MKTKEQLAEKYITTGVVIPDVVSALLVKNAYIAGFKASRKAALKLMKDSEDGDWDFLAFQLRTLGDEE